MFLTKIVESFFFFFLEGLSHTVSEEISRSLCNQAAN